MLVNSLTLKNFRNYADETFRFGSGLNIVCGRNAQGKTNSAEAIFMLCTGYSPRVKRDKQLIKDGEQTAEISARATANYGDVEVAIKFFQSARKTIRVNGVAISKVGELMGNINSVFFSPNELKLIQESPEDRRRFLDISLSQMNKRYFYALKSYSDVLSHRNSLLKSEDRRLIDDTIRLWDVQLVEHATYIILERNAFLKSLAPHATNEYFAISQKENLQVEPIKTYGETKQEIMDFLFAKLTANLERDVILGYTTVGPHRDDIRIMLDGEDIKVFGSQGQQRTAALALKLAELRIFKERFNEYPVLILDDALSELDVLRQRRLLERISGVQTIITCTKIDDEVFKDFDYKKISVSGGKII